MFLVLSLVGSLLAAFSIFAMFGKVASHPEAPDSYFATMFEAAFGKNASSSIVTGLLVLFILAVIVIILSVINIIFIAKKSKSKVLATSGIIGVFVLVNAIMSFCTLKFFDIPSSLGFKLGVGPIIFSVLNIIALVSIIAAFILYFVKKSSTVAYAKNGNSDSDTADTLAKYKKLLDDGAITKEEYNRKKSKLLDK